MPTLPFHSTNDYKKPQCTKKRSFAAACKSCISIHCHIMFHHKFGIPNLFNERKHQNIDRKIEKKYQKVIN